MPRCPHCRNRINSLNIYGTTRKIGEINDIPYSREIRTWLWCGEAALVKSVRCRKCRRIVARSIGEAENILRRR
jgi:hypothetical protein